MYQAMGEAIIRERIMRARKSRIRSEVMRDTLAPSTFRMLISFFVGPR